MNVRSISVRTNFEILDIHFDPQRTILKISFTNEPVVFDVDSTVVPAGVGYDEDRIEIPGRL